MGLYVFVLNATKRLTAQPPTPRERTLEPPFSEFINCAMQESTALCLVDTIFTLAHTSMPLNTHNYSTTVLHLYAGGVHLRRNS